MTSSSEVISNFENCITDSVTDSVAAIERNFALSQSHYGHDAAVKGLAMAFVISENRRRCLENNLRQCAPRQRNSVTP
ncbi:hypothetical protein E5475_18625 [Salmonella enterica]|uniref:hypothetical protein n=1 Tax=Salmonella enterica TaxID=28901 RepID=UPI0009AE1AC5|nr:hypothetical protein [Salmonella enterica]EAO4397090.1 hypothetical protein [Salmonella enterica]EJA4151065.1 hypothetical protein [Salmonella enterica]